MSAKVLGVLANTEGRGKGHAVRRYALVFTSTSIVVMKLAGALRRGLTAGVGVALGGPIIGQEVLNKYDQKASKKSAGVYAMPTEDILAADKMNYAIPYSEIVNVELKKGGVLSLPRIQISTADKKHTFRLLEKKTFKESANLVSTILPDKVTVT